MEAISVAISSLPGLGWLSTVEDLSTSLGLPAGVGSLAFLAVVASALVLGLLSVVGEHSTSNSDEFGQEILVVGACGAGKSALVQTVRPASRPSFPTQRLLDFCHRSWSRRSGPHPAVG